MNIFANTSTSTSVFHRLIVMAPQSNGSTWTRVTCSNSNSLSKNLLPFKMLHVVSLCSFTHFAMLSSIWYLLSVMWEVCLHDVTPYLICGKDKAQYCWCFIHCSFDPTYLNFLITKNKLTSLHATLVQLKEKMQCIWSVWKIEMERAFYPES